MAGRICRGIVHLGNKFKNIQLGNLVREEVRCLCTAPSSTSTAPVTSPGKPYIKRGFDFGHLPFGPHWGQPVSFGRDKLPLSVDWTKVPGAIWPAQDQGKTGLCYVFAPLGSVGSLNFIKTGESFEPSAQQVFDCNTLTSDGNFGGEPFLVLDFIENHGILPATLYPFTGEQGICKGIKGPGVCIDGWKFIQPNSEQDLKYAVWYQPVVVSIRADGPMYVRGCPIMFNEYAEGFMTGRSYTDLDHSALLVGYGETDLGELYWILLNSYGIFWGQDGIFWLRRGTRQPGGALGILREPLVPLKSCTNRIVLVRCDSCGRCL